jgi:uncharacterized protein (TIGR02231 family)
MKKIIGLLGLVITSFGALAADRIIVPSTVTDVTVYTQGAQIFRRASYTVKPGVSQIVIEGVSPNIDPKSLQVNATGAVIILDSKYTSYYPEPDPKLAEGLPLKIRRSIALLEDSVATAGFDLRDITDEIDVLTAAKTIIISNGSVRGQGKVNDSTQLLKATVDYYTTKMSELNRKIVALQRRKRDKDAQIRDMNARLTDLRNYQSTSAPQKPKGPVHQIIVTVSAKEAAAGKLSVSYLVSGASWVPSYDMRTDINTGKINLTYKAEISQSCGEDWEDVRLTVSTNNPYQNKTRPVLHPWYVDYYVYNTYQLKDAMAGYTNAATPSAKYYDREEAQNEVAAMDDEKAASSTDFSTMINRVLSAEFKIDLPYTIKSNGEGHIVLVKQTDLNATFKHIAVPKLDAAAFLVAQIVKLDELQLVPATANIFFDGTYIGETYLDPTTMDDTLSLSLGKDPNIVVRRTHLKSESKEKVLSNNQIERTMSYEIEVKNLKSAPITINVKDQLPVTRNADITIEPVSLDRADHNETTGILNWEFTVKPKEYKKVRFSYKVKHNKDQNVLLN